MARNLCANVMMEEGYMRMSVEFDNNTDREKIENTINIAEDKYKLYPSVIRRNISETAGNYSLEFQVEGTPREAGEFFQFIMSELGIDHCEA